MDGILEKILLICVGGFFGFMTARVKWSIEKEKILLDARRAKLQSWRESLEKDFDSDTFKGTVAYSEIRPYLSRDTLAALEYGLITSRMGRGGDLVKSFVLDDLVKLEKDWKLI